MSQYFENDPNLKSIIKEIDYTYKKENIKYNVDLGVFSKDRIDFGTNTLLQALPELANKTILDVGCGYGAIGLALAKVYKDSSVTMIDVNLRAIELVKQNIIKNRIKNATVFESNCYENVLGKFDIIISNPPIRAGKKIVHEICLSAIRFLNDEGKIYVVIQKKQGAESLLKAMKEVYKEVNIIDKKNGYFIFEGVK